LSLLRHDGWSNNKVKEFCALQNWDLVTIDEIAKALDTSLEIFQIEDGKLVSTYCHSIEYSSQNIILLHYNPTDHTEEPNTYALLVEDKKKSAFDAELQKQIRIISKRIRTKYIELGLWPSREKSKIPIVGSDAVTIAVKTKEVLENIEEIIDSVFEHQSLTLIKVNLIYYPKGKEQGFDLHLQLQTPQMGKIAFKFLFNKPLLNSVVSQEKGAAKPKNPTQHIYDPVKNRIIAKVSRMGKILATGIDEQISGDNTLVVFVDNEEILGKIEEAIQVLIDHPQLMLRKIKFRDNSHAGFRVFIRLNTADDVQKLMAVWYYPEFQKKIMPGAGQVQPHQHGDQCGDVYTPVQNRITNKLSKMGRILLAQDAEISGDNTLQIIIDNPQACSKIEDALDVLTQHPKLSLKKLKPIKR